MTDEVFDQILFIRSTGITNMFDVSAVLELANQFEFMELAAWLPEHRKEYSQFILTGER